VPPKYGDSSGVRGAAWLWSEAAANASAVQPRPTPCGRNES